MIFFRIGVFRPLMTDLLPVVEIFEKLIFLLLLRRLVLWANNQDRHNLRCIALYTTKIVTRIVSILLF
jgi:hypothetical protein